jgi:hypothetical protein
MWKKGPVALLIVAMFGFTPAMPASASSGTLYCGSGGWPLTSKQGDPAIRDHYVQGWGTARTNATYVSWPFTVGSRTWSVTPGTGSGTCQI